MKKRTLKNLLKIKFPNIEDLPKSFEIIGDIAIIEIKENLKYLSLEIAKTIIEINSSIKVVLEKTENISGEFRTKKLNFIYGENRKETIYKENGILLKLNVEQVYFSSKLSTEREFLSRQVKDNEKILVMFSGCGPYTFNILKANPNIDLIDSIEINPKGHFYALENLKLNKNILRKSKQFQQLKKENNHLFDKTILENLNKEKIHFFKGDVKIIIQNQLKANTYDKIYMPLPKDAGDFLDDAFKVTKKNSIIYMYDFIREDEFPNKTINLIKKQAKLNNINIEILEIRKVGQYSPRRYRVCCSFKII